MAESYDADSDETAITVALPSNIKAKNADGWLSRTLDLTAADTHVSADGSTITLHTAADRTALILAAQSVAFGDSGQYKVTQARSMPGPATPPSRSPPP